MIAKFNCRANNGDFMELGLVSKNELGADFRMMSVSGGDEINIHLSKDDLFEMIGYLLRLQSKLKKEGGQDGN